MIIIKHDTHDYYDSLISQHGFSKEGHIYDRQFSVIKDNKEFDFIISRCNIHRFQLTQYDILITTFCVVFCGKMYPGVYVIYKDIHDIFYSFHDLEHFLNKHQLIDKVLEHKSHVDGWFNKPSKLEHFYRNRAFNVIDITDECIERKLVVAVFKPEEFDRPRYRSCYDNVEINPILKNYKFYKVFDPYSCYQEISMFVDGQLAYPGNIMIEVEDKYRIAAHGFDHKYAFRKPPSK